jgi:hypothetical protein
MKQIERDAYGPNKEYSVPNQSFFSNKGKYPACGAK